MGMNGYLSKPLAERDLIAEIIRIRSLSPEDLKTGTKPQTEAAAA
jgi:hypothetical protein